MKAITATGDEDLVRFADLPQPEPAESDALVKVAYLSINRGELHRLRSAAPGWMPGWDFAGTVVRAAASGGGPARGTRVAGVTLGGAWAQYVRAPATFLATVPDSVSLRDAAALPVAGVTARRVLALHPVLKSARVLVTGAAGGVGRYAVQLAARAGSEVTAVVGSKARAAGLLQLGAADVTVGMPGTDRTFDLVLDSVGGGDLARSLALVTAGGTVVSYGNSARGATTFPVSDFYPKQACLRGYYFLDDVQDTPPHADLEELLELCANGSLHAGVGVTADWQHAPGVLAALAARQISGKAVLRVTHP